MTDGPPPDAAADPSLSDAVPVRVAFSVIRLGPDESVVVSTNPAFRRISLT
nr:hypothetical protein [Halorussus sp. MSC15.2]